MDDKTQRGGTDRALISLDQPYEVRGWAIKFGVSKEELMDAVEKVGDRASDVEAHLKLQAH